MIVALVPVKALADSKSRLAARTGRAGARELSLAMMADVVEALLAVRGLERVAVVTPDPDVAAAARAAGAQALLRDDGGLNASIEAAAAELAPQRGDGVLVVLGDVAALSAPEVEQLLAAGAAGGVALAPSRDGGTSALLRVPRDLIPARFGPDSAKRHREEAQRAGARYSELALPSLAIDVDVAEDAEAILACPTLGRRTRAALAGMSGERAGRIELRALPGIPRIAPGDDLAALIEKAAREADVALADGVLVVCQKVVSKAEGRMLALADVEPSAEARRLAAEDGKDPRHIEIVLRESARVVRRGHRVLICETRHGFVCANAGVDLSNAPGADVAVLLPLDPDASARRLRDALVARGAGPLAVVISDTFGRPWREGLVDVALGSAGIAPLQDLRGTPDLTGRPLEVTTLATADQLAAAAGLLMAKDAGLPAVWVRGVTPAGDGSVRDTLRDPRTDLFR